MDLSKDLRTRLESQVPMETRAAEVTPVSSTTSGAVSRAHNNVTISHVRPDSRLLRPNVKVRARTNVPGFVSRPFLYPIVIGGSSIMSGT